VANRHSAVISFPFSHLKTSQEKKLRVKPEIQVMHIRADCDRVVEMYKHVCVRSPAIAGAIFIVLAISIAIVAENLSISINAEGSLDAQFHGLEILATIKGEVSFVGDIPYGKSTINFSADGNVSGVAFSSILNFD
jgi:hypothetical protein